MTICGTRTTVSLSVKDWFGIIGVAFAIFTTIIGVYLHHDRQLTTVLTRQEAILDRIDRVEGTLDRRD